MNWEEIALLLGLPKDTDQKVVLGKLAEKVKAGDAGAAQLATLGTQLGVHGLKLENGQLVKLADVNTVELDIKTGDSAETVALKTRLATSEGATAKTRIEQVKKEVDQLSKDGKVPPAVKDELSKLLLMGEKATTLALSQDGSAAIQNAFNATESLRKLLNGLKPLTGSSLSRLSVPEPTKEEGAPATKEELSTVSKDIVNRVTGKRKDKKTA